MLSAVCVVFAVAAAEPRAVGDLTAPGRTAWRSPHTASGAAGAQTAATNSGSAYYEFLLAHHLESQGDIDGAIAAYRRAASLDSQSADIPAELAALYARMNQAREAIEAAEAALKIEPTDPDAHRVLGMVYGGLSQSGGEVNQEYLTKAITHLEQAQSSGGSPEQGADVALARLYLRAGQADKAIARLTQVAARDPEDTEAMVLLVQAYADAGRSDEAVPLVEKLAAVEPQYYRVLGELHERDGRWSAAAEAYGKAAAANPASTELKMRWATALLNSPNVEHAGRTRSLLEQVIHDSPNDTRALYLFSQVQRRTKDLTGAEATARRIMAIDPKGTWGPSALSQVLEDRRDYAQIVELLEPVAARWSGAQTKGERPDVARIFAHLAMAYQETKHPDRAISTLEAAGRFSADASIPFQLGAIYERQKRYLDAERAFLQALDRDPKHAPTLNYLGYMLAERGERLPESVAYIRRALEVEPDNPSYLDSLGWAYFKLAQLDRAESSLRRASELLPTNSTVQDHWGDLLFALGRYGEAIAAWELALAGDGDGTDRGTIEGKIKGARTRVK